MKHLVYEKVYLELIELRLTNRTTGKKLLCKLRFISGRQGSSLGKVHLFTRQFDGLICEK